LSELFEFVGYDFQADYGERWVRWTPEKADREPALDAAVQAFEPVDNAAGRRCAEWLPREALRNHPSTVTHLLLVGGDVHGYFALCSGHARLSQRDRERAIGDERAHGFTPVQPVAHVAWLAKRRHTQISGLELITRAIGVALEVIDAGQGQIALSLNAFDDPTARMWRDRYGFRRSQPLDGRVNLWRRLFDDEDGEYDED
jgi:hypothetical protein